MKRALIVVIFALIAGPALADSCDAAVAAMVKETRTPHRYENTVTRSGQLELQTVEIVAGGKQYIELKGAFFASAAWGVSDWDENLVAPNPNE